VRLEKGDVLLNIVKYCNTMAAFRIITATTVSAFS